MSYRMSKSMVLSALFLMALPVVAFAQTSRLEGMTLQGDYVKDYTSIFTYPSQVPNVGNLAYGEVGNTGGAGGFLAPGTVDQRAFGSVLGNLFDGRFGSWGIHLRETTPPMGHGSDSNVPSNNDPNTNGNEEFDLMWGKKFGTMSLGARLHRSFEESITSTPGVQTTLAFNTPAGTANARNLSRNLVGLGGGISFEMNPNSTIDIGLLYQNRSYEQTVSPNPGTNEAEDSPTAYQLSGRMMWQYQSNMMITPVFKYYSYDLSRKEITTTSTTTFNNTLKGWQLGAAANWSLGSNDMLVWGVDLVSNKIEQDDALFGPADTDITETVMPRIFAALETHVNPWLTLRMGASKGAYTKVKTEPQVSGGTTTELTSASFDMNLGAGVKLGTVQFDAVLANNAYSYANGLLGGVTPDGGFFPKVTATYSF